MKKTLVTGLLAVTIGLTLTAGSCQSTESDTCHWELDAYSKPGPRPKPNFNKGGSASKPKTPSKPRSTPKRPSKAPKGHHWEWDCD